MRHWLCHPEARGELTSEQILDQKTEEKTIKMRRKNLPRGFKTSIERITVEMTYVVGATRLIKREM